MKKDLVLLVLGLGIHKKVDCCSTRAQILRCPECRGVIGRVDYEVYSGLFYGLGFGSGRVD